MSEQQQLNTMDFLSIISVLLGYENLIENRQQSAQNDVQAANDKQAKMMLEEIHKLFKEQNETLKEILQKVGERNGTVQTRSNDDV